MISNRTHRSRLAKALAAGIAAVAVLIGLSAPALADALAPFPADDYSDNSFNAVACPATGVCFAVGGARSSSGLPGGGGGFITKITPTAMTPSLVPMPDGSDSSALTSISCPTASFCIAIGSGITVSWNGTSWTTDVTDIPDFDVTSLACGSAAYCLAGGFTDNTGGAARLSLFNGSTWTELATPAVTKPWFNGVIHDVTCPGATTCMAVGGVEGSISIGRINLPFWKGYTFVTKGTTLTSVPNSTNLFAGGYLNSVRCSSLTSCVATGSSEPLFNYAKEGYLTEKWNGARWTKVTTTNPADLNGVSLLGCSSTTSCVISSGGGLVGNLTGTTYTLQSLAHPDGTDNPDVVEGVCLSASDCYGVGTAPPYSAYGTGIVAHYDGTTWTTRYLTPPA